MQSASIRQIILLEALGVVSKWSNEPLIEVYTSKDVHVDTSCNVANIINYYLN